MAGIKVFPEYRTGLVGIVEGMPLDDYLAVDALSASGLKRLARSPWYYRNCVDYEPTPAMLRGTLVHCAVLEPDALGQRYVVVPEDAPRRPTTAQWAAKKPSQESIDAMRWWKTFATQNQGREIVSSADYALCRSQLQAINDNPEISKLLREGIGEASIFWIDKTTGLYCKARPDWLPAPVEKSIMPVDIKTCADESPSGFGRAAARLRYDLQAAHYTSGIESVTRLHVQEFVFAAVSNKPPILAVPYVMTDEIRDQGREERRELMDRLAWCLRENEWPAYGSGFQLLDFPAYAKRGGEVDVEWSDES